MTRVQCEGLRLVAVSRFLYNCQAFCGEVQSMLALLSPEGPQEPPKDAPQGYRPITEVSWRQLGLSWQQALRMGRWLLHMGG